LEEDLDNNNLDGELSRLKDSGEGKVKMEEAKKLLPALFNELSEMIGGKIETKFDLNRVPKVIKDSVEYLKLTKTSGLGDAVTALMVTSTFSYLLNKFRPYILDEVVAKKQQQVPTTIMVNIFAESGSGKDSAWSAMKKLME